MDIKIQNKIVQLEKQALELKEQINALNFRMANTTDVEAKKRGLKELKQLTKDLELNNKELNKSLKELRKS